MERLQGGVDLVGIVREVVDHGDAGAVADGFQPPPQSFESGQRRGALGERHAERTGRGERGQRVRRIMAAGDHQRNVVAIAGGLDGEAEAVGEQLELLAHQLGAGAVEAVADALVVADEVRRARGFRDRRG